MELRLESQWPGYRVWAFNHRATWLWQCLGDRSAANGLLPQKGLQEPAQG